ncbi:MAG: hypothetical protein QM729_13595 [Solirubrobacterales bacterium]
MPGLAVIGHPVAHSRSPDMQTAALAELGLAGEWTYGALDIAPEDFEAMVAELAAAGEYAGVNVTVPHKEAALAMADEASEGARAIGAANTLSFVGGRIAAANTDAGGLLRSLPPRTAGGRALVLGAGGAARGAIWALAHGGEGSPDADDEPTRVPAFEVDVWNRTAERAEAVAAEARRARRRRARPGRLRADRQHHRGRARRRGPVRAPAARRRLLRPRPGRRRHGLRRGAEPAARRRRRSRRHDRRRPRDARPAGCPLTAHLDR